MKFLVFLFLYVTLTQNELLGYDKNTKLLIINADDYGMSLSANKGTESSLERGVATSATMMVPCPWILDSFMYIKRRNLTNIGIHVTLNNEYTYYSWKGVSTIIGNSLLDKNGFLYKDILSLGLNGRTEDIKKEIKAQLDLALNHGIDLSHFDSHMGSLYGLYPVRLEILALGFAVSYEYGLPWRIPYVSFLFEEFKKKGHVFIDYLLGGGEPNDFEARKRYWMSRIPLIQPGVSEILMHPSLFSHELEGIMGRVSGMARQYDHDILIDSDFKNIIKNQNISLINYRRLRDLQRNLMKWNSTFRIEHVFEEYKRILFSKYNLLTKEQKEVFGSIFN